MVSERTPNPLPPPGPPAYLCRGAHPARCPTTEAEFLAQGRFSGWDLAIPAFLLALVVATGVMLWAS